MEDEHVRRIEQYTGKKYLSKIINLDIPDEFEYFEKELVLLIFKRFRALARGLFQNH